MTNKGLSMISFFQILDGVFKAFGIPFRNQLFGEIIKDYG